MVREIVELLLGGVGRQILYFYEAHALIINSIILTYGCVILMSWLTLNRIYRHLVVDMAKSIHLSTKVNKDSTPKKVLSSIKIHWDEPVNIAKFPLIASQTALLPVRKTVNNVKALLDDEELAKNALAVLNGQNPRKIMPSYRKMAAKKAAQKNSK